MTANAKPVYKRILFELNGEVLWSTEGFGTDANILDHMAQEIKELVELGIQADVVVGGGNLFRGVGLVKAGMNHVVNDHTGMLATIMDDLAIRNTPRRAYVNVRPMSAIPLNSVRGSYSWAEAISLLRSNRVVILSADTGSPFSTADSVARLRGIEIEADVVLKATKVDGVLTADPAKDSTVTTYEQLTYNEVPEKELRVMGLVVFMLVRNHKLPIHVFNMSKSGALRRVVMGGKERALITG